MREWHLFDLFRIAACVNAKSFYENLLAEIQMAPMGVAESSISKGIDSRNR